MSYTFDVFISYKSEDLPWAKRLFQELGAANVKAYWDKDPKDGLDAGHPWRPQLQKALDESGALVALWSQSAARINSGNDQERFVFEQSELRSPIAEGRPVIFVRLKDSPAALNDLQGVEELREYARADEVPAEVWRRVAERIKRGARQGSVVYVDTLVLAATKEEMQREKMGDDAWGELTALAKTIGLGDDLAGRYGPHRWDWKPYGGDTLRAILENLQDKAAKNRVPVTLAFEEAEQEIWSKDPAVAEGAGRRLASKLTLILIDPLSLYVNRIQSRMPALLRSQDSPTNAFAVLAPLAANDDPLNSVVQTYIGNLYLNFFQPTPPPLVNAPVGMHVRNAQELLRVLLIAQSRKGDAVAPVRKTAMTAMGHL